MPTFEPNRRICRLVEQIGFDFVFSMSTSRVRGDKICGMRPDDGHEASRGMTGQWDLATWELDPKAVRDMTYQTRRVFEWAQQVLAKCGLTFEDVVSTTTFLRSMKDLEVVIRITSEFIPAGDVTSTAVAGLDFVGAGELEINFVALFPDGR